MIESREGGGGEKEGRVRRVRVRVRVRVGVRVRVRVRICGQTTIVEEYLRSCLRTDVSSDGKSRLEDKWIYW